MNQSTLIPTEAALYLGQEIFLIFPSGDEGYLTVSPFTLLDIGRNKFKEYKLLLRPLADITEEEYADAAQIFFDKTKGYKNVSERHAARFAYLLSKGFDLFGFIEAGKALDKTKATVVG